MMGSSTVLIRSSFTWIPMLLLRPMIGYRFCRAALASPSLCRMWDLNVSLLSRVTPRCCEKCQIPTYFFILYTYNFVDRDRESASTVALAGSLHQSGGQRLEVQADLVSAQRFSLSSLSESVNASIADDTGASVRALAGSMLNYKTPGSDSCSCVTTEDCISERVRFDDNVSFITSSQAEKTSIGSSCSFRARCATKSALSKNDRVSDTLSNDSVYIDIDEKQPRKYSSQAAILRSQFFHSINDGKPTTKSLDDKTIIEVSNETLDKQSQPLTVVESSQQVLLSFYIPD
nr:uncharacterized protein LOC111513529 [Leptinotarsa decemlineata]